MLEKFAYNYSIPVDSLRAINSYRSQKSSIRAVYRRINYVYERFHRGSCCICHEQVEESSCMQLNLVVDSTLSTKPPHLHLVCCNSFAHEHCIKKLASPVCPACNSGWRMLVCGVCHKHMSKPDITVYEMYLAFMTGFEFRTKCCKADIHPQCFDYVSGSCPVCQVELDKDCQPIFENRGGSDYVYLTRALRLNEKHRREATHYSLRPDWATGIIDDSVPFNQYP